jgi:hypothetical protein
MMFADFVRHLQALSKVESLIARIWLTLLARRFAVFALAGLIALFGLGMADLAAFFWLQASLGAVWAAAVVALANFAVAAILAAYGAHAKPGPEMELATELRSMALESLQADARALEANFKTIASGFVSSPLDAAAQKLLLPAIIAVIKGLRARRGKTDQKAGLDDA